jgi:predicted dinucleotide-binding enzyme
MNAINPVLVYRLAPLLHASSRPPAKTLPVRELLEAFGWKDVIDLGDISNARAAESYMPLWLASWNTLGTMHFNIEEVR